MGPLLLVGTFVAFLTTFLIGVTSGLGPVATAAVVGAALLCVVWSLVAATRANRHRPACSGIGVGTAASAGSVAAGAFLVVGSLFAIGWFVVLLVMSCRRYSGPAEVAAVRGVAMWREQHPDGER